MRRVTSGVGYTFDGLPSVPPISSTVGSSVSIPVFFGKGGVQNTGIAILDLDFSPPVAVLTLRDSTGAIVPGAVGSASFSSGKRVVGLLDQLLPRSAKLGEQFTGTLMIELRYGSYIGGAMSVVAIQFDGTSVTPVAVETIR